MRMIGLDSSDARRLQGFISQKLGYTRISVSTGLYWLKINPVFSYTPVFLLVIAFSGLAHKASTALITKTCLFHTHFCPEINFRFLVDILTQVFYRLEFLTSPLPGFCVLLLCYEYNFCFFVITQVSENDVQKIFKGEKNVNLV